MDIYFYGSCEGSARGFVLQRYNGAGLAAAGEESDSLPFQEVCSFFAYDVFRILWKDVTEGERRGLSLITGGSLLGIRGLKGRLSGREAVLNLAFTAEKEETAQVFGILQNFLSDFRGYTRALFSCMTLGKAGECQVEPEALEAWLRRGCDGTEQLAARLKRTAFLPGFVRRMTEPDRFVPTERELFRFAVCMSDWKDAQQYLKPAWLWKLPPEGVLDSVRFQELF